MLTYADVCRWVTNSVRRAALDNFWLEKCPQLMERQWPLGAHFTCFTGTKVQMLLLMQADGEAVAARCSVYFLYRYKSTNAATNAS